ncbi:hypothetical protein CGRA01v4_04004 [Colletotrichum graminicola]|nr:hypothetical protein CGRA01v4_04004 [Colletotrichum graminicola]
MVYPKTPHGVALAARRRAPISNKRNLHVTLRYALPCTNSEPRHQTPSTPTTGVLDCLPSQRQP